MTKWQTGFDPNAGLVIDQITYFRLSRSPHNYPVALENLWWSVLLELEDTSIDQFEYATSDFANDLLIPIAYDADDRGRVLPSQPLVIYARKPLIEALNLLDNPYQVISVRLGATTPERFLDQTASAENTSEFRVEDDTVITAIIDDGIAIAHDLFRNGPVSSRIHHARIFDAEPEKTRSHSSVGRALDRAEIDKLLSDCTFGGMLDEDLFYARTGQVDMSEDVFSTVALQTSHGTHVAGLAAGYSISDACKNRPIICAALPSRIVTDTTGLDMIPTLYLAFHILAKQARRFRMHNGKRAPVIFNFSYGNTGGPHDGTGIFAKMFDFYFGENAASPKGHEQTAWLTLPAGNNNLNRLHAIDDPAASSDTTMLELTVLPDDRTPSQVQIWLPHSLEDHQPDLASIKVTAPFEDELGLIRTQPGQHAALLNSDDCEVAWLAYQYVGGTTERGLVTLSINPTGGLKDRSDTAPAGVWKIEICRSTETNEEPIHIWVRRDETLHGHKSGGRQAFFSNGTYKRFGKYGEPLAVDPPDTDSPVRRSGTISGFACGATPITVAAYSEQEGELSPYSAAGPLNPSPNSPKPMRSGPDVAAMGDESQVLRGVLSAGSRSGSWVRLSGTSVATPRVARAASKDIADFKGDGRAWCKVAAKRDPFELTGRSLKTRAGAGGICIPVFDDEAPD